MDGDSPARSRRQTAGRSVTAALGAALSRLRVGPPLDDELGRRICYYLWK